MPVNSQLDFKYIYRWNRMNRKGYKCALLVRGSMNSCAIQFEDGHTCVTSRNALRKIKPHDSVIQRS